MKHKLNYLLFVEPIHVFEGRQMYRLSKKIRNIDFFLTNKKLFWDIYDNFLGSDLMYDLALNHTFEDYFSRFPEDEEKILEHILFI